MAQRLPVLGLLALAAGCSSHKKPEPAAKPLECKGITVTPSGASHGNPGARNAAQNGLGYLVKASEAWTAEHKCFGCHVQGVTMEALAVGMHHQYDIASTDIAQTTAALELGATAGGHSTGVAFEGQAWARYDNWVDSSHTKDLLRYAEELVRLQSQDGAIPDDDARLPVTGGVMHTTYQAMQTWRQAFARTADDKWLAPMRKAERYLAQQSAGWTAQSQDLYLQNINLALLGLVAAGVAPSEDSSMRLQKLLLARQHSDGGWGLDPTHSDALATGQTLYTLRLAGHGDGEATIDRGTEWLVKHQQQTGGWHTLQTAQGGADKGEAMWAVLGLVQMDVTSVAVNGLGDGQHVTPDMKIKVEARDNQAGGVAKLEMFVDDQPVAGACADKLDTDWSTKDLGAGKHTVEIVATNSKNQTSKRRFDVYAGNVFLTDVGSRFDDQKQVTEIALRDIASAAQAGSTVALDVYATDGDGKRGEKVYSTDQAGTPGAMTFAFSGKKGRYIAELAMKDKRGDIVQKTETTFTQDTEANQKAQFAEIEGNLEVAAGASADTTVELVNDKGDVIQRAMSTEQGKYRFKSVSKGAYKVRVAKKGFATKEAAVEAKPAAPAAKADLKLQ